MLQAATMMQHMTDDETEPYFSMGQPEDLSSAVSVRILKSRLVSGTTAPPMGDMRTSASSYDYSHAPEFEMGTGVQDVGAVGRTSSTSQPMVAAPSQRAADQTFVSRGRRQVHVATKRAGGGAAGWANPGVGRVQSPAARASSRRPERSLQTDEAAEPRRYR
jgi:hypothetical protein